MVYLLTERHPEDFNLGIGSINGIAVSECPGPAQEFFIFFYQHTEAILVAFFKKAANLLVPLFLFGGLGKVDLIRC